MNVSNPRISLGGGHCCVCTSVCGHIGGPFYCSQHQPGNVTPTWTYPTPSLPVYPDIDRAREREGFRERLQERMEADRRLLERIEEGPVDWRSAWAAEAAKFQAETITTSFLATRLRDGKHSCDRCNERVGSSVYAGPGQHREWLCVDCVAS